MKRFNALDKFVLDRQTDWLPELLTEPKTFNLNPILSWMLACLLPCLLATLHACRPAHFSAHSCQFYCTQWKGHFNIHYYSFLSFCLTIYRVCHRISSKGHWDDVSSSMIMESKCNLLHILLRISYAKLLWNFATIFSNLTKTLFIKH